MAWQRTHDVGGLGFGALMLVALSAGGGCGRSSAVSGEADGGGATDPADAGAVACSLTSATVCPDPPLRYADIAPFIEQRCVPCHKGDDPDAAWPLITYRQVADWASVVRDDVYRCTMPPADGGIPILDDERMAILTWVLCGHLE